VLGPIEVYSDDEPVHVGGVKQRSILALLIASHGLVVSADRVVDEIYGEDAAVGVRRSVQTIISMLRRDLGDVIVGTGDGYRFDAARDTVDVCRFEDGVAEGLALVGSDARQASSIFDEALGLWRGDPYSDVDGRGVFQTEIARLSELRFTALEARAEADLACGRHREVVAELEALVAEYPLRERLWSWLMLALYRTGRQADALATYQQLRTVLGEKLGLEPSTELRELEDQILLQDPALDLVPMVPHNLPASLTSFVGRDLELIELGELLSESRLVTLTGAGGSGKTRLAVEFGRQILDEYLDGVWLVDLRGIDAEGVAPLIVSTLGLVVSGGRSLGDQVVDGLSCQRLLLILDNCEHVLDGVAPLLELLMRRGGPLRVLATSRESLGVPGESMVMVRPLSVPEWASVDDLADSDAAVLFAQRAGSARPDFVIEEHVASVFEICRSVEGLPLALELAAARLLVFSPEELADRLDDQIAILKMRQRTGDLRHSAIESTIRWSWDLLDDAERALLGRLSVLPGSWSLDAAEAVCGFAPVDSSEIVDFVGSLVEKSLVVVEGESADSTRFRLLEPVRQYASRAVDDQQTARLRDRIVDYWSVTLARSYEPGSQFGWRDHDQARALEADQASLTAAVEWALGSERFDDAMTILASPFGDLLLLQGSAFDLVSVWIATAIDHRSAMDPGVLLSALEVGANIASGVSRQDVMLGYAELGAEMSRTSEERRWWELTAALATHRMEGHSEATTAVFRRIASEAETPGLRASTYLADAFNRAPRRAWVLTQKAMEYLSLDSPRIWDECRTSFRIFDVAEDSGHYEVATQWAERALDVGRRYGFTRYTSEAAARLAYLNAARGRHDEAAALIDEAVQMARRIISPHGKAAEVVLTAASVARLRGDLDTARRYAAEATLRYQQGSVASQFVFLTIESALLERDDGDLDQAQDLLGDAAERFDREDTADSAWLLRSLLQPARASVELRRDNPKRALEYLQPILAQSDKVMHLRAIEAVDLASIAFAQQGRAEQAALLKGAVDHERERAGLVVPLPDTAIRDAAMLHAQSILEDDWDATVQQGHTLPFDEAVELAAIEANADADHKRATRTRPMTQPPQHDPTPPPPHTAGSLNRP